MPKQQKLMVGGIFNKAVIFAYIPTTTQGKKILISLHWLSKPNSCYVRINNIPLVNADFETDCDQSGSLTFIFLAWIIQIHALGDILLYNIRMVKGHLEIEKINEINKKLMKKHYIT